MILVGIGCPMLAALELPLAAAVLRRGDGTVGRCPVGDRLDTSALDELRRRLAELPETEHPLGL